MRTVDATLARPSPHRMRARPRAAPFRRQSMIRSLRAFAHALRSSPVGRLAVGVCVVGGLAALVITHGTSGTRLNASAGPCTYTVTPSSLGSAVSSAAAGQTICLGAGDYGTWGGTNKAITIQAASGAAPTMKVNFGSGDSGFTLDGLSGMGGVVAAGAHDFTIRNSTFTSTIDIAGTNANILLDHNSHDWNAVYNNGSNAKIFVWNTTGAFTGVTVQNSTIRNGNLDGVHLNAGMNILNSVFANLCDTGTNHTDNVQFEGGQGGRIAGNYVYEGAGCNTQGITSYDSGTVGVTIEDNVVDIRRPWGIELYSDKNSIVRHNTMRYYAPASCSFNIACGQIDINRKSEDPAGTGTQVYDNLATSVGFANGSTGTQRNNVSGQRAVFVGPLSTYAGFKLSSSSPVGLKAASDGLDAGARVTGAGVGPGNTPGAPGAPGTPGGTGGTGGAGGSTTTTGASGAAPGAPAGAALAGPSAARLPAQMVASYGFDEPKGKAVRDSSGSGNDGTIDGATRTRQGRHGRALRFDGHDDDVAVPYSNSLTLTSGMTLEAWVRPASGRLGRRGAILRQRPPGAAYGLYVAKGLASARVRTVKGVVSVTGGRLRANRWSHVAASYDGGVLRLYVNSVLRARRTVGNAIAPGEGRLSIGSGSGTQNWFKGRIDDVVVWRVPLSGKAITADAYRNAGASSAQTG
jgi:hypothetical protein